MCLRGVQCGLSKRKVSHRESFPGLYWPQVSGYLLLLPVAPHCYGCRSGAGQMPMDHLQPKRNIAAWVRWSLSATAFSFITVLWMPVWGKAIDSQPPATIRKVSTWVRWGVIALLESEPHSVCHWKISHSDIALPDGREIQWCVIITKKWIHLRAWFICTPTNISSQTTVQCTDQADKMAICHQQLHHATTVVFF